MPSGSRSRFTAGAEAFGGGGGGFIGSATAAGEGRGETRGEGAARVFRGRGAEARTFSSSSRSSAESTFGGADGAGGVVAAAAARLLCRRRRETTRGFVAFLNFSGRTGVFCVTAPRARAGAGSSSTPCEMRNARQYSSGESSPATTLDRAMTQPLAVVDVLWDGSESDGFDRTPPEQYNSGVSRRSCFLNRRSQVRFLSGSWVIAQGPLWDCCEAKRRTATRAADRSGLAGLRAPAEANGLDLFIIERQIRGKRYHVSTGAHTITAAREPSSSASRRTPLATTRAGGDRPPAGHLTDKLVEEWEEFQLAKGNTPVYVRDQGARCCGGCCVLGGADLRKLTLRQLREGLTGDSRRASTASSRSRASSAGCAPRRGSCTTAQDATLDLRCRRLAREVDRRARWCLAERREAARPPRGRGAADALRERRRTTSSSPAPMRAAGATACCCSPRRAGTSPSSRRFIRGGELLRQASGDVLAVLVVRHKGGDLARTPIVHREHLEAAERLRASGEVPRNLQKEHVPRVAAPRCRTSASA
jgi:hypothetical protein